MASLLKSSRKSQSYATFEPSENDNGDRRLRASWSSWLLFSFVTPLMELGASRQLKSEDLWDLDAPNRADAAFDAFSSVFEVQTKPSPLLPAVFACYGPSVALCGLGAAFSAVCSLLAPVVLNRVIVMFEAPELDTEHLAMWVGTFFLARMADALLSAQTTYALDLLSLRLTVSLKSLLFRKVLRRKVKGIQTSDGDVDLYNLFTSDAAAISLMGNYINNLWILPIQAIVIVGLLYWVLDVAAFAGLAVVAASMAVNYFVSNYSVIYFAEMMRRRDARMKTIKEVFTAIQTVKFNAWEGKFASKIDRLRDLELSVLKEFLIICAVEAFAVWATPLLVSTTSFAVYVLVLEREMTAARVFTSIALFNALRGPLQDFPNVIQMGLQSKVALNRMQEYLELPEFNSDNVEADSSDVGGDIAVEVQDGTFGWSGVNVLSDVNISIRKCDFVVVHGEVGAGKSSLCSALLGEMEKRSGRVVVRDRVAFYSQQPWVQNMTIRDNILFGNQYDSVKYKRVLEVCCLLPDLQALPAGDETEIGHSGINLSGGQKARVSLARACYSNAGVFILDSPLAAVDAIVQAEIFSKCFCTLLEDKTLILVTHNPAIINSDAVNYSIHVENGRVTAHRRSLCNRRSEGHLELNSADSSQKLDSTNVAGLNTSGQLIQEEKREEGRVSKEVFWVYFRSLGGFKMCVLVLTTQLLWQIFQIGSDLWLSHWTSEISDPDDKKQVSRDMAIYAALAGAGALMVFVRSVTVVLVGMRGARYLFDAMTKALLHAPMRFFDVNPIGRISSRYGVDISSIDFRIPLIIASFLSDFFVTLCQLATAVYTIKLLGILILPLAWLYIRVADFYLDTSREVSRLRRVVSSPVLNFVSQCEDGLSVIRAFGPECVKRMERELSRRLDVANKVFFVSSVTELWYIVRIQLLGSAVIVAIVSALVYLRSAISPGLIGLAFSYALSVDAGLSNMVRQWSYVEMIMVSPERVMEYASLEPEGANQTLVTEVSDNWPRLGNIEFDKVVFRYKDGDAEVLKRVSFSIRSKEKIGIVGRTGAGKSSLTMALFRMNELVSGRILIDGIDIATVPLTTLRSRVSIIPQAPVLFKGPLRAYMDPFDEFSDAEIWGSLDKVDLKDRVAALHDQMHFELAENGENFSVGERQLLCMARALLTKSRIVVMDEATASIDHKTELNLQEMITRDFEDVTVLTIAHRLSTVLKSDRVLVLKDGQAIEFDTPANLVRNQYGTFYHFANESGNLATLLAQ